MEAELISANEAMKEAAWLEKVAMDLGESSPGGSKDESRIPILYCDNQATTQLTADTKFHNKAKHIKIRYMFIRNDMVARNRLSRRDRWN